MATHQEGASRLNIIGRFTRWLDATPHPLIAIEISSDQVAAARFLRTGAVSGYFVEDLPKGALNPSAIESNLANPAAVKGAINRVCESLDAKQEDAALSVVDLRC